MATAFHLFGSVSVLTSALTLSSPLLTGCVVAGPVVVGEVALSKSRADIQVTEDAGAVAECKLLKEVRADSSWGGVLFQEKALEKTIADMTKEAADAGANVLLIKSKSKSFSGSRSEGAAYLCPSSRGNAVPSGMADASPEES